MDMDVAITSDHSADSLTNGTESMQKLEDVYKFTNYV